VLDTGTVVLALIQQPEVKQKAKEGTGSPKIQREVRAAEIQPGIIWKVLQQGLGLPEAHALQQIELSRLSYTEKSKKIVTDTMVLNYLTAEAARRNLREHSLPPAIAASGLRAVAAPVPAAHQCASARYACSSTIQSVVESRACAASGDAVSL
jgi:hypothetical protein